MMVVMISVFSAISLIYIMSISQAGFFIIFLLLPIFIMIASYFINRFKFRSVWDSPRLPIDRPTHLVLPDIFKALTEEGIPFTLAMTDGGGQVSILNQKWDQVINLDYGGLNIHLLGRQGGTLLYLGPEEEGNKDEFARVKGLIERVARDA